MRQRCPRHGAPRGLRQNPRMQPASTDTATRIRTALAQVQSLRQLGASSPALAGSLQQVKQFQSRRFAGSYADLLVSPVYRPAARFFLEELYGERDYSERDAQFARIAGALQKLFPQQVMATALMLAELHASTETLDHAMAQAWLATDPAASDARRYLQAWRSVGQRAAREAQLTGVLAIGQELNRLTRTPGLRLMLKMMRGPAKAAGLNALQRFLEAGFDTFADLGKQKNGVAQFLGTVQTREADLMAQLFDADFVTCETRLQSLLGQAR